MKKGILALLMVALLAGCTSANQFGKCIGAFEDGEAGVKYKPSAWNIALGIIFVETIIVPIFVVLDETRCPTNLPPKQAPTRETWK